MLDFAKWVAPVLGGLLALNACDATTTSSLPGAGGTGGGTTTSGPGGGGSPVDGSTFVGQACSEDAMCGDHPASFCVTALSTETIFTGFWAAGDESGAGVAGGYCTRSCDPETPCPDGSRCGGGICLQQCDFGAPGLSSLDAALSADKCWGRDDLMCVAASGGDAVCMPNCGSGAACEGRACDARYGACTAPDRNGFIDGAQCQPDNAGTSANEDPCAGLCLELQDGNAKVFATVCTSRCSLGGSGMDCGGPDNGLCAIQRAESGGEVPQLGDQGFCAAACDRHDACGFQSGLFCLDLGNYASLGKGYCVVAEKCDDATPCDGDLVCTPTAKGKVCLDEGDMGSPLFPLGAASP